MDITTEEEDGEMANNSFREKEKETEEGDKVKKNVYPLFLLSSLSLSLSLLLLHPPSLF